MLGQVRGQVDAAGDDQRQRRHPDLGDWRQAWLGRDGAPPDARLVMITSVAICHTPLIPAEEMNRFINRSIPSGRGCGFLSSTNTATFAGSSNPSAMIAMMPTTM